MSTLVDFSIINKDLLETNGQKNCKSSINNSLRWLSWEYFVSFIMSKTRCIDKYKIKQLDVGVRPPAFSFTLIMGMRLNLTDSCPMPLTSRDLYRVAISCGDLQYFSRYEFYSSLNFFYRQKVMHLSPPCRMHSWAQKELITSHRCVEMVIPWQLCRTISSLTLHRQEI